MVPVSLSPKPGFCIKSTTLSPAVFYPPASRSEQHNKKTNLLEVPAPVDPVVVPQNRKVFVNIAWDTNVPPPPEGTEEAIQNAMQGDEEIDEDNPNGWFVPVIVSNAKADKDKGTFTFCCSKNLIINGFSWKPLLGIRLRVQLFRESSHFT